MKPAISSEIGRVFVAFPPREKFATNLFFNTFFGMKRRGFFVKETRLVGVGPPAMTTSSSSFCKCVLGKERLEKSSYHLIATNSRRIHPDENYGGERI